MPLYKVVRSIVAYLSEGVKFFVPVRVSAT